MKLLKWLFQHPDPPIGLLADIANVQQKIDQSKHDHEEAARKVMAENAAAHEVVERSMAELNNLLQRVREDQ